MDAVEASSEGKELDEACFALSNQLREALGLDVANTFENLVAQSVLLYAHRMFDYSFNASRHPESVFGLPDSEHVR